MTPDQARELAFITWRDKQDTNVVEIFAQLLVSETAKAVADERELLQQIYEVATGEKQVAIDDTEGMEWIAKSIKHHFSKDEP